MLRPLTAANRSARPTASAPMPLAPDLQNTRRARINAAAAWAECRDETTCLRPKVPTGHKVLPLPLPRPDTTESKTLEVELQRTHQPSSANQKRATNRRNQKPLLQNTQERTNRNTTDTMESPETATITPLARDKQQI